MNRKLFSKIVFVTMLAIVVNIFVYFAFGNVYSSILFNKEVFLEQYTNGVYQYRFLSIQLLLWTYDVISALPFKIPLKMYFWDAKADPNFFLAYAALNTIFLVLFAIVMVLILESKKIIASETEKILLVAVAVFSIGITQFVIVPYDCSSYFFLLLFIGIFLRYLDNGRTSLLILLLAILVVSTINRETSALSISFAAVLLFQKFGIKKESVLPVFFMGISFVIVYILMRVLRHSFSTNDGSTLVYNFTQIRNWIGILFWIIFFWFSMILAKDDRAKKSILLFHVFALPYIIMCFYTGALYEIRLYIPLFLSSLILGRLKIEKINNLT